jgi:DNA-binding protein HU-beta
MAKSMTKTEIISHLAEKSGLHKKQVVELLEELSQLAYKEANNGFPVPGLGKLVVVDRAARMGRNPKTGEPLHIPAKRTLKFRLAKEAKDAIAKLQPQHHEAAPAEIPAEPQHHEAAPAEIPAEPPAPPAVP